MTPQIRFVLLGTIVAITSKYAYQVSWERAATMGLAAISFAAILTAQETQPDGN